MGIVPATVLCHPPAIWSLACLKMCGDCIRVQTIVDSLRHDSAASRTSVAYRLSCEDTIAELGGEVSRPV
jgi:hypothetical protein